MKNLDDSMIFESIDRSGMLKLVENFPDLLVEGLECGWAIEPGALRQSLSNVLVAGYGGSAISGDILRDWFSKKSKVPVEVCRGLRLPGYVDERTLVMGVSYSGETEESLMLLASSVKAGCKVAAVTSGGTMSELCEKLNLPMVRVRGGLPPRAALPLLLSASAFVLSSFNLVGELRSEVLEAAKELKAQALKLGPSVDSSTNPCKKLALELPDSMPTIYSLERMSSVARRLKNQFNENSKIPAKFDLVPEACHNEIEGWSPSWLSKQSSHRFPVILIRDNGETLDESSRMDGLRDQLESVGLRHLYEIKSEAKTDLGRLLLPIHFGDFVSVYLALVAGLDPTPVQAIQDLKARVGAKTHARERLRTEFLGG